MNNPMQMLQQFQQFASTMTPQGAKAEVERLLQSGEMSQEQFNNLSQMVKSFSGFGR